MGTIDSELDEDIHYATSNGKMQSINCLSYKFEDIEPNPF